MVLWGTPTDLQTAPGIVGDCIMVESGPWHGFCSAWSPSLMGGVGGGSARACPHASRLGGCSAWLLSCWSAWSVLGLGSGSARQSPSPWHCCSAWPLYRCPDGIDVNTGIWLLRLRNSSHLPTAPGIVGDCIVWRGILEQLWFCWPVVSSDWWPGW